MATEYTYEDIDHVHGKGFRRGYALALRDYHYRLLNAMEKFQDEMVSAYNTLQEDLK